jgi:hypothetical protein
VLNLTPSFPQKNYSYTEEVILCPTQGGAMLGLDALELARIQFAFTVSFHIIFPAITIGLASYLAVLEGLWLKTRNEPTATCTISGRRFSPSTSAWAWFPVWSWPISSVPTGASSLTLLAVCHRAVADL